MAKARFSSGIPTTSDGSLIPRSNWELTKSLQLFLSVQERTLRKLQPTRHIDAELWETLGKSRPCSLQNDRLCAINDQRQEYGDGPCYALRILSQYLSHASKSWFACFNLRNVLSAMGRSGAAVSSICKGAAKTISDIKQKQDRAALTA